MTWLVENVASGVAPELQGGCRGAMVAQGEWLRVLSCAVMRCGWIEGMRVSGSWTFMMIVGRDLTASVRCSLGSVPSA